MLLASTNVIEGKQHEVLGLVRGVSIYSKNVVKDIGQALKSVAGGELKAYTELLEATAANATKKMEALAESMGADAVVGVGYSTSNVVDGSAEIIVYGTAIRFI